MNGVLQDLRHAARQMRKSPGFTAIAVLTLALGIGANTALFTLVHAVMLKSLPVAAPDEIYTLGDAQLCCDMGALQGSFTLHSYQLYEHLRDHTSGVSSIAAFQSWPANLSVRRSGTREPAQAYLGEIVSGNYFPLLGVGAFAGRALTPDDDRRGAAPVAMISYRTWSENFGMDLSMIGGSFLINGQAVTIIGVAPPGFFGETLRSDPPDFWLPLSMEPALSPDNPLLDRANVFWLYVIGRVRPGEPLAAIEARLNVEIRQWLLDQAGIAAQDRTRVMSQHMALTPAGGGVSGIQQEYGKGLRLLVIISAFVLAIACANVANLLLARGAGARSEMAVRAALGASRAQLVRQTLVSGVVLALLGGAAGVLVAYAGTRAILVLAFRGSRYVPIDAVPSWPVLAFALAVALLTGVVCSTVPARLASKVDPASALRGAGRSTGAQSTLAQRLFIIGQAALSLVLLAAAGLLTESLGHLENQAFGFETGGRVVLRVNPALAGYTPEQLPGLYRKLDEALPRIPGVLSASYALHTPMDDWDWSARLAIEGRPAPDSPANQDRAYYNRVSPSYFETTGTRLLRGRLIDEHDTQTSRHIALINETFATRYFPRTDPVGRHFGMGDVSHLGDYEIAGIVEDTKYRRADVPADAMFFLPLVQTEIFKDSRLASYQNWSLFIDSVQLRVAGSPGSFEPVVRRTLSEINPNLTILKMTTFADQVSHRFNSARMVARLAALFALLALALACIGLYGVAGYLAAQRTNEIGLRMALGAGRGGVLAMMLRQSMTPAMIGLGIGIPVAIAGGYAMRSQLYGVSGWDPVVLAGAVSALVLSAALAAVVPARRAATIDPIRALRDH